LRRTALGYFEGEDDVEVPAPEIAADYNKTKKLKVNRIVRPPNKNLVNPYVSAFSKPLGGGYILANNGRRSGRYDFLLGK